MDITINISSLNEEQKNSLLKILVSGKEEVKVVQNDVEFEDDIEFDEEEEEFEGQNGSITIVPEPEPDVLPFEVVSDDEDFV